MDDETQLARSLRDAIRDEATTANLLRAVKRTVRLKLDLKMYPSDRPRAGGIDRTVHTLLGSRHVPKQLLLDGQIGSRVLCCVSDNDRTGVGNWRNGRSRRCAEQEAVAHLAHHRRMLPQLHVSNPVVEGGGGENGAGGMDCD